MRGGIMKTKLSRDEVGQIFSLHALGNKASVIAEAIGRPYATVVYYLNAAGIVLGNKGKPRQCTEHYLSMALDMRAHGSTWYDVEQHIGFHRSTFQARLRAERAST
jgi:hypothetical protein